MIDFDSILDDIEPSKDDIKKVNALSDKLIEIINHIANINGYDAEAVLLGSVAKNTWISTDDKEDLDIDIFIKFPLSTSLEDLKAQGLELAQKCIKKANGTYEERYASHPYLTGTIDGYQIDIVPCYDIKHSNELKSAVDRTILHTEYVMGHLKTNQEKEVRLLKRFMKMVGTYGSEFKVGGFSGYLCELMVLHYGSFLKVLKSVFDNWEPGYQIDLEKHETAHLFHEPLVVVDPTDKNRNVSAALTLQKMSEFIIAGGNFLKNPKKCYFYPKTAQYDKKTIREEFNRRETASLLLTFCAPKIPSDALHPQIKKTENSMVKILETEDFGVLGSYSWSNDDAVNRDKKVFILLEMNTWTLPIIKKRSGPKIWDKNNSLNFLKKHPDSWIEGDLWKTLVERDFQDVNSLINGILKPDGINRLRVGKHLKKEILNEYQIMDVIDVLDSKNTNEQLLYCLNHYLHKNELLTR